MVDIVAVKPSACAVEVDASNEDTHLRAIPVDRGDTVSVFIQSTLEVVRTALRLDKHEREAPQVRFAEQLASLHQFITRLHVVNLLLNVVGRRPNASAEERWKV